jgi:hypothetical protein
VRGLGGAEEGDGEGVEANWVQLGESGGEGGL